MVVIHGAKERTHVYEIRQEGDGLGVHIHWTGIMHAADVNQARREIFNDPQFTAHRYQLWNAIEAQSHTFTADQVRGFAMHAHALSIGWPRLRIAIVAPPNFFQGLDRLYHIFSSVWTNRDSATFTGLHTAREWAQQQQRNADDDLNDHRSYAQNG